MFPQNNKIPLSSSTVREAAWEVAAKPGICWTPPQQREALEAEMLEVRIQHLAAGAASTKLLAWRLMQPYGWLLLLRHPGNVKDRQVWLSNSQGDLGRDRIEDG